MKSWSASPNPVIDRLVRVAKALGPLNERVVLIGGSIAPMLHTEPLIRRSRPTDDVDGVIDAANYVAQGALQKELRAAGFTEMVNAGRLAHRWRTPDGDVVDLVPTGTQLGSTGQEWDSVALRDYDVREISPNTWIRHVRAPLFLTMKLAAFRDRGRDDPLYSVDLEDIFALVLCRASIVDDVATSANDIPEFVSKQIRTLMADGALEDLLAAHLNNAHDPAAAIWEVRARLEKLAGLY